jgi:SAM-dependent methyltransferase
MAAGSASVDLLLPPNNSQRNWDQDAHFFSTEAPVIPAKTVELLENYSGIPAGEAQLEHVQRLRDRAFRAYHYPCLGFYRFLGLQLSSHPLYNVHVLPLLRGEKEIKGATDTLSRTFLDLGTCLGQDLRKLIFDGAPVKSVYGADLLAEFVDIGYDLFRDEDRLPRSHFLAPADIFDQSSRLKELDGKVDVIHANSVFHLFSWEDQLTAAKRVATLMRPSKGSLILGSQVAHQEPGGVPSRPGRQSETIYMHDQESWKRLWERVGQGLGLTFTVKSSLESYPKVKGMDDTDQRLSKMKFEIWRD